MNRILFGKNHDQIPLPDLIQHQRKSFEEFKKNGIQEVIESFFPISDHNGSFELQFHGFELGEPTYSPKVAQEKNKIYEAPLKGKFRLINNLIGGQVTDQEVFMGDIPVMANDGRFIYNGKRRVVVTQIVKSPGVYYESEVNDKGKTLYFARIQPENGEWIRLETDRLDMVYVRLNKGKKILLTVFLKALGLGDDAELLELFGHNEYIKNTLEKDDTTNMEEAMLEFYSKIRPHDPSVLERAQQYIETTFYEQRRFDLQKWGRFKMNQKLTLSERVWRKELAEPAGGYPAGTIIDEEVLSSLETPEVVVWGSSGNPVKVIGNESPSVRHLTLQDIVAAVNYLITMKEGIGKVDNIDHLANRRLRMVGENMANCLQTGMKRVEKIIRDRLTYNSGSNSGGKNDRQLEDITPQKLIHVRPLVAAVREFLGSGQLSQYIDQINPLAELNNKRRTSALGPGGLQKDRAGVEVRDVHYSHYGKICPIETPEGSTVGLINQISVYAQVNEYGFLTTPFRKVDKVSGTLTDEIHYLTADEEERFYIAQASEVGEGNQFINSQFPARHGKEYPIVSPSEVDYVDVSTKQPYGIGACLIPFLENDDANRAVMGSNMQRQGVPLIQAQEPIIGTGMERTIALNTSSSILAEGKGRVVDIENESILVQYEGYSKHYPLLKFVRTNDDTCWNHFIRVTIGQEVEKGTILADSNTSSDAELAVGQNLLMAFLPMEGYNFEDSIVLSSRIYEDDILTPIMISEYSVEVKETKLGVEEITKNIPYTGEDQRANLDEDGIVKKGTYVRGGDILVGKRSPKAQDEKSPYERILEAVYDDPKNYKDTSLRMDNGSEGVVIDVIINHAGDAELKNGVEMEVKIFIADKRKIEEGDKLAGRHGNKGVVSIIMPEEDMPFMEDGTPIDVVLNPLGVPSRMNIGQVMEVHLGMVARHLGVKFEVPVFGGVNAKDEIHKRLVDSGLPDDGKFVLYDGKTGERYDQEVTVGVMYMMKLSHQVIDKIHARSTGPYSLVTQQPLGGRAQMGGQRFGEMEVWALEAYGASATLQEVLTLKSDDVDGRLKLYGNIVKGLEFPKASLTESFKVLLYEMRALGLDTDVVTASGKHLFESQKPIRPLFPVYETEEDLEDDENLDPDLEEEE